MEECKHGLTKETCAYCTGRIIKPTEAPSTQGAHYLATGHNLFSRKTRAVFKRAYVIYKANN